MTCSSTTRLVKVGELALETGKSVRTLHYYEELGLLKPASRSAGGFRLYDANAAGRIKAIERLQSLSVPLSRIKELASAWTGPGLGRDVSIKVKAILVDELDVVRRRLRDLTEIEAELSRSLTFLVECGGCDETPHRDRCGACGRGNHDGGRPPEFVDAFLT